MTPALILAAFAVVGIAILHDLFTLQLHTHAHNTKGTGK